MIGEKAKRPRRKTSSGIQSGKEEVREALIMTSPHVQQNEQHVSDERL
jgi:hypothetical protein